MRTVVITGGNTGLGYACAAALLGSRGNSPWHIVLACRNLERGRAAAQELTRVAGASESVESMSLDLAQLASVRLFADRLSARIRSREILSLYGLVCNAGVQSWTKRSFTADGFETTFGVNHLGHFVLVNLLLPAMDVESRIVVVSSGVHDPANNWGLPAPAWNHAVALSKGELGSSAAGDSPRARGQRLYSTSKLANIYFTYGLARRLPVGMTVNAFDPGLTPGTGLTREAPAPIRFVARRLLPRAIPLLRQSYRNPNVHTVVESGRAMARLMADPLLAGVSGKYYEEDREVRSSPESYDEGRAEELWQTSKTLTGLA